MFDLQQERWLDIAMPAPRANLGYWTTFVFIDSHILRLFCHVKQDSGSTQIYNIGAKRRLGFKVLGGQPALFIWLDKVRFE